MTLSEALLSVWQQVLVDENRTVQLGRDSFRVTEFRRKKLRVVEFTFGGEAFSGIEQNPQTASRWAQMAREGQRVMQFRCRGRYVANVAKGKLTRYPAWGALALPE
jgi:hypothetical protein